MDTALEPGDWAAGANGLPMRIEGRAQLLQAAKILLTVPRGSFVHRPDWGSRLFLLRHGGEEGFPRSQMALQYAQEALAGLPGVRVLRAEEKETGAFLIILRLTQTMEEVELLC